MRLGHFVVTITLLMSSNAVAWEESPERGIWVQPAATAFLTPVFAQVAGTFISVPLGLELPTSSHSALVLELNPVYASFGCGDSSGHCMKSSGAYAAVGMMYFPGSPKDGLFLQPKVTGAVFHDPGSVQAALPGVIDRPRSTSAHVMLGLDLGYRFKLDPVFVEPILGIEAGYAFNTHGAPTVSAYLGYPDVGRGGFAYQLNLNLLRVGLTF
jgi:hypothetical protein